MTEITMFPTYSQQENVATNNVMLLFKTIYNESVLLFERVFSELLDGEELGFGVKFEQQVGHPGIIADGYVSQRPINLFIEVKRHDWHYEEQINAYVNVLKNKKEERNILLLLANFEDKKGIQSLIENSESENISIHAVGYDDILKTIKQLVKTDNDVINTMLEDFETYLNNSGLLPVWKHIIDVIPCYGTIEQNEKYNCYSCPNTGGAYWHSRAKYIGFYKNKRVDVIGEIDAILNIKSSKQEDWEIRWNNTNKPENELLSRARNILENDDYYGIRDLKEGKGILLFLISNFKKDINWVKETSGGIMGRRYFRFSEIKDIDDLTDQIKDKTWGETSLAK